jgi:hypothetical protein
MIFPSDFRYDADGRIHLLGTDLYFDCQKVPDWTSGGAPANAGRGIFTCTDRGPCSQYDFLSEILISIG